MSQIPNSRSISRRRFLKSTAALAAVGAAAPQTLGAEKMKKEKNIPVGVQLWCVRDLAEKDFPRTIEAIAKMGYEGVEFAGFYKHRAEELRKMLDDNSLKCCGSHTHIEELSPKNLPATVKFNKILGNKNIIVPWLDPEQHKTKEAWIKEAHHFNELAEKLKPEGMRIGYHGHGPDFKPINGEMPWDIFFSNTNKDVIMQVDTGNTMSGGGDPIACLKKYPGRTVTIHLKEFSATNPKALIGEGDLDWQQIFSICETTGGTEWYIIEEEKDAYPPLIAIEKSLENYKKLRA